MGAGGIRRVVLPCKFVEGKLGGLLAGIEELKLLPPVDGTETPGVAAPGEAVPG